MAVRVIDTITIGEKEVRAIVDQTVETMTMDTMLEPDPGWRYTDKEGHTHLAGDVSTLKWMEDLWHCGECRDVHDDGYWVCAKCKERITPGTRMSLPKTIITSREITVRVVGVEPVEQTGVLFGMEGKLIPVAWNSEGWCEFAFVPGEEGHDVGS